MLCPPPDGERSGRRVQSTGHSRRAWIVGVLAGLGGTRADRLWARNVVGQDDETDADEIAKVHKSAAEVGLKFPSQSKTKHFLCLGDASSAHCSDALKRCESLTQVFVPHFRTRGFTVELPERRMTVIALKDNASYRAYYGTDPGQTTGGHYDRDTNRLVVFDFRPEGEVLGADAARVNLFTLIHETAHQLTFNTGILDRSASADVPAAISEGFATYVEMWRPRAKGGLGTTNGPRLQALIAARQAGEPWIPISDLLAEDQAFDNPKTEQIANAEAWVLVHYLIKARLPRFRAYLAKLREDAGKTKRNDPDEEDRKRKRIDLAEKELGALKQLDRDVLKYAQKLR